MGWNDIFNNGNNSGEQVEFTKLPEGTTRIRILDAEPYSRWSHWLPEHKMSVTCAGKDKCPICDIIAKDKENGVTPRYNSASKHCVRIWNYDTNREEILDQGVTFWRAVGSYMKELGDLRNYDIKVIKSGKGRSVQYSILPLTESKFEFADKVVDVDFERIFRTHDRQTVLRILDEGREALKKNEEEDDDPSGELVTSEDVPF